MSMSNSPYYLLLLLMCLSCSSDATKKNPWQKVAGRNDEISLDRRFLYRARVPLEWSRKEAVLGESLLDTKKALCEWEIGEDDKVSIVIHNFPNSSVEQRIPPQAQVERWKGQFDEIDPLTIKVESIARGGFVGLFFEATGAKKGQKEAVLAWAMQLATVYLNGAADPQVRADYTIKVVGSPESISKNYKDIVAFANSFELIEELVIY